MTIHFGTDGWRAIIGEEFTFENVRVVAQAVADHTHEVAAASGDRRADLPKLVVGYDTRFMSESFAVEVTRVLAANGIRSYLTRSDAPAPVVSYAIRHLDALGGVMITASHNPPRYNGIELKAAHGGSINGDECSAVEACLAQGNRVRTVDLEQAQRQGLVVRFDPAPAYNAHLNTLLRREVIASRPGWVVVDAMHGAGRDYIRNWLSGTGWQVPQIRGDVNPGFGGINPEPIMPHLEALQRAVVKGLFPFGVAIDGDADRTGAIDGRGRFVDPQCIFALALRYLVEKLGRRGTVVKTVSTTRMIDRLCARYGLPLVETPVGFDHIADLMAAGDVLIGGEESGAISVKGHVPVGDGILVGLLLVEMVAEAGMPLAALIDDLHADVGPAHYARRDLRLSQLVNKKEMTARLSGGAPAHIAGVTVQTVQSNDGVKYLLADGGWLLIRPSGTELVLRVYAEAPELRLAEELLAYGTSVVAA